MDMTKLTRGLTFFFSVPVVDLIIFYDDVDLMIFDDEVDVMIGDDDVDYFDDSILFVVSYVEIV